MPVHDETIRRALGLETDGPNPAQPERHAALERFLSERERRAPGEGVREPTFAERHRELTDRELRYVGPTVREGSPTPRPSRSSVIPIPTVLYRRADGQERAVVSDPAARLIVRNGELVLIGHRGDRTGSDREIPLRYLGTSDIAATDTSTGTHLDVDVDAGTVMMKMRPSRPALREPDRRSELTRLFDRVTVGQAQAASATGHEARREVIDLAAPGAHSAATSTNGESALLRDTALGLLQAGMSQHTLVGASTALDSIASYDFASFEYLLEPVEGLVGVLPGRLSDAAVKLIDEYEAAGHEIGSLADFLLEFESGVLTACVDLEEERPTELCRRMLEVLYGRPSPMSVLRLIGRLSEEKESLLDTGSIAPAVARAVASAAQAYEAVYQSGVYERAEIEGLDSFGYNASTLTFIFVWDQTYLRLREEMAELELGQHDYPFAIFAPRTVNLGVRLVYRQDWSFLGVQPGEVVKTVPLGPGQSMKVSTKVSRRHKMDIARDTSRVVDRSTESADTVKDSSEVVRETAQSHNWEIAMEGSFGYGFGLISAECTRGPSYGGETSTKSRAQANQLSEKVRKTASKMQTETKVHVATERETAFEQETATELRNPNDEVALTYEYFHLQHLYETFTRLAEIDSVVLVAEEVPTPTRVNAEWVRRHASVLSRVLLDEAHRSALEEIASDDSADEPMASDTETSMKDLMAAAAGSFASFTGGGAGGGLTIPDIYSGAVKGYLDWTKERHAAARMDKARRTRWERLLEHLRDNILHYCRAIWTDEDVEQRMLRYRKLGITVPVQWNVFSMRHPIPGSVEIPVGEVIDPTPPIGFVGNYAVHRYQPPDPANRPEPLEVAIHLDDLMQVLRGQYVDPDDEFAVLDPDLQAELLVAQAQSKLTDAEVFDLLHYLPRLRSRHLDDSGRVVRDASAPENLASPVLASEWAEYRFRKHHSDRVLMASGNLYLDLRIGTGSAVEPFKRLHRAIDGFRAIEDRDAIVLDNERRRGLLADEQYGDPDVERVTVVKAADSVDIGVDVIADAVTSG